MESTIFQSTTETTEKGHLKEGTKTKWSQILIAIACLSFFPLLYLMGSMVVSWFK